MKIGTAFPSTYIKCDDLQGRAVQVRMNYVKFEDIGGDNKPVLFFVGKDRGLVLNKTNANMIAELYGDETEAWPNQVIELYPSKTDFQGKRVDCIRVREPSKANGNGNQAAAQPRHDERTPPPRDLAAEMDDEIPF